MIAVQLYMRPWRIKDSYLFWLVKRKKNGRDAAKIDFELISGYRCHSDNTVFPKHTHKTPKTQTHEQYRIELVFLGNYR
jgi:hypothetical protein